MRCFSTTQRPSPGAGAHPHRPGVRPGRARPHVRRALPQRRELHRQAGGQRVQGGHLRAVRGPQAGQGHRQAGRDPGHHPGHGAGKFHAGRDPEQFYLLPVLPGGQRRAVLCGRVHRGAGGRPSHRPRRGDHGPHHHRPAGTLQPQRDPAQPPGHRPESPGGVYPGPAGSLGGVHRAGTGRRLRGGIPSGHLPVWRKSLGSWGFRKNP